MADEFIQLFAKLFQAPSDDPICIDDRVHVVLGNNSYVVLSWPRRIDRGRNLQFTLYTARPTEIAVTRINHASDKRRIVQYKFLYEE